MASINLQSIYWYLTQALKRLGIFGLIGIMISIACGLLYFFSILPMQKQLEMMKLNASYTSTQTSKPIEVTQAPLKNTINQMSHFYNAFSTLPSLTEHLSRIFQAAAKQKLSLNQGDYKFTKTKLTFAEDKSNLQEPLSRYEMVLPITGDYLQIRQFIAQILYDNSTLALSNIQISRENTLTKTVDARLELLLFLKGDS